MTVENSVTTGEIVCTPSSVKMPDVVAVLMCSMTVVVLTAFRSVSAIRLFWLTAGLSAADVASAQCWMARLSSLTPCLNSRASNILTTASTTSLPAIIASWKLARCSSVICEATGFDAADTTSAEQKGNMVQSQNRATIPARSPREHPILAAPDVFLVTVIVRVGIDIHSAEMSTLLPVRVINLPQLVVNTEVQGLEPANQVDTGTGGDMITNVVQYLPSVQVFL